MILVIYHDEVTNKYFLDYLQKNEKDVLLISFKVLQNMRIYDQTEKSVVWENNDCKIDMDNITGIYNEIYHLTPNLFKDHINSDQEYVCAEWSAYLMYFTQKYRKKMFNPFNHYILSGDIFHLPYLYKTLGSKGINVPKLILSMDFEEINEIFTKGDYIPLLSTTEKFRFEKSITLPVESIGLLEYCEGTTIIAHVICDKLFCCKVAGDKKIDYELPKALSEICVEFTKELGLKLSEFIFRENVNHNLILYRFSILPRFINNSQDNLKNLYDFLITELQHEA